MNSEPDPVQSGKGELENELHRLVFPEGVKIFRPSLLLGKRDAIRLGEKVAAVLMSLIRPLLFGKRQRYRAITGDQVAAAMLNAAQVNETGFKTYEGAQLFAMART